MNKILDYSGTAVSWACLVHCLAMPFLISALPLAGLGFLADERAEWFLIALSVLFAAASFLPAYLRQHRRVHSISLFLAGIAFIVFSHEVYEENFAWQASLLLLGAVLISAAHLLNLQHCRACANCRR